MCLPCCLSSKCITIILVCAGLGVTCSMLVSSNVTAGIQTEQHLKWYHWTSQNGPLLVSLIVHVAALCGVLTKNRWLMLPYAVIAFVCALCMIAYVVMMTHGRDQTKKTYVKVTMSGNLAYAVLILLIDVFIVYTFCTLSPNMSSDFQGKWQLVESENFDGYMKEVGVGLLTRTAAANLKPLLEVTVDGDKWKLHQTSTFKNHTMEFEIGKETELETADGRKMKSVFTLEDGKLVQKESPVAGKDKPSEIVRFVDGNKLVMTLKSGAIEAKRVYEKQ
ncbi:hypothetical protein QR680_008752 [Steinernema hermaphroditum]|uniref:Cytosolic fatty-acid binding proteins domain-containing protein n=1 Tax=Steinernema hermaphroditum TaxID=289476 RepID=A0AA39IJA7_9BILA|nr:hypothetical protein QR680_008752 [Steinernema hermaphroditum]